MRGRETKREKKNFSSLLRIARADKKGRIKSACTSPRCPHLSKELGHRVKRNLFLSGEGIPRPQCISANQKPAVQSAPSPVCVRASVADWL